VLHGVEIPIGRGNFEWGRVAHNNVGLYGLPFMCGGDAAFLLNYFDHLFYRLTEDTATICASGGTLHVGRLSLIVSTYN